MVAGLCPFLLECNFFCKTFVFHVKYGGLGVLPERVCPEEHVVTVLVGRGLEETEDSQVVASSQGAMKEE